MATHSSMRVGKSHGHGILVSGSPWGHKELDTTECAYGYTTVGSTHLFQRADQMLQFDPTITQYGDNSREITPLLTYITRSSVGALSPLVTESESVSYLLMSDSSRPQGV